MAESATPGVAFPMGLGHKHGLDEWWPMLPERSAETIEPGVPPSERFYRCQKVGCVEVVRLRAADVPSSAAVGAPTTA